MLGIESAIIVATARDEPTTGTASITLAKPVATMQDARQAGSVMTALMSMITLGSGGHSTMGWLVEGEIEEIECFATVHPDAEV